MRRVVRPNPVGKVVAKVGTVAMAALVAARAEPARAVGVVRRSRSIRQ